MYWRACRAIKFLFPVNKCGHRHSKFQSFVILPNIRFCHHEIQKKENVEIEFSQNKSPTVVYKKEMFSNNNSNVEEEMSEPDILLDTSLTEDQREKIKKMKAEYEIWKYADSEIPQYVSSYHWKFMLDLKTPTERILHLTFVQKTFEKNLKQTKRKEKRKLKNLQRFSDKQLETDNTIGDNNLIYAHGHNTIIRRLHHVEKFNYLRSLYAYVLGPKIIFDLSFIKQLTIYEQNLTFLQLKYALCDNLLHRQPAAMIFTSFDINEKWFSRFLRHFSKETFDEYPIYTTDKSYVDLFPTDNLVYLTPDGNELLTEFDSDKVYIIGAIVDKKLRPKLSFKKANEQGIVTQKLPLEYYVKWECGTKYLALNHVLNILLDVNMTNDWYSALKIYIPERKVVVASEEEKTVRKQYRQSRYERMKFLLSLVEEK